LVQDKTGGLEDLFLITIGGEWWPQQDILQELEELRRVEIDLLAQAIAHPQMIEVQRRLRKAAQEHVVAAENVMIVLLHLLYAWCSLAQ
jgi:hypothetical protein